MSEDKKRVIDRIKAAADNGDLDSQFILATMYDRLVEYRNKEEAFKYYTLAAENGIAEAQYRLGDIYYYNKDLILANINKELAFKYYKLAADNGYAPAQYVLGSIYYQGMKEYITSTGKSVTVVSANSEEALKYYKLAAFSGVDKALINVLALCYAENKFEDFEHFYIIASNSENEKIRLDANNMYLSYNRKKKQLGYSKLK